MYGLTFIILKKEWYTHDRDVLDVPDVLPLPGLIERLNTIIAEEHLKWMIFTKSVDVIALDDKDMTAFSGIRDDTWKEKKKLFGL